LAPQAYNTSTHFVVEKAVPAVVDGYRAASDAVVDGASKTAHFVGEQTDKVLHHDHHDDGKSEEERKKVRFASWRVNCARMRGLARALAAVVLCESRATPRRARCAGCNRQQIGAYLPAGSETQSPPNTAPGRPWYLDVCFPAGA
jgi:hypothetical protein